MRRPSSRLRDRLPALARHAVLWLALPCAGCATSATLPQTSAHASPTGGAVPASPALLAYCDLAKTPRSYAGREVRVVGVYRHTSERSEMYSLACPAAGTTWVEWSAAGDCGASNARPPAAAQDGTFGFVVRGIFHRGGEGYGHLNAFDFRIDAQCTEALELLDGEAPAADQLSPAVRAAIERFENEHRPTGGS